VKHCEKTLEDASACREVRSASVAFKAKILKYEQNLTSDLALLALDLDPRSGNKGEWVNDMKPRIRAVLSSKCGIVLSNKPSVLPKQSIFLETEGLEDDLYTGDEFDDFFDVTQRPDPSCRDVLLWWKTTGVHRFRNLALLSRAVFMVMGSSVPSEAAFLDSGQFVRPDRGSLSDAKIETMMKLRSWNRYLGIVPASRSTLEDEQSLGPGVEASSTL
jgi:hAT family C-terminal dimerisation region